MKNILILGGSGALGKAVVNSFKNRAPLWNVTNIDFRNNSDADLNIILNPRDSFSKNEMKRIQSEVNKDTKLDCIVNSAGGWKGGSIEDDEIIEMTNQMMFMNLYSSIFAAYIAKKCLNENSLLVLTGSNAVKKQFNAGMLSYHLSKQSVHHFTELLAAKNTNSEISLPKNTKIITILPETIDTEANRQAMPQADFSKWTSPHSIAKTIKNWADSKNYPDGIFYQV